MAGRRIDDHSSWVGKGEDGMVFPMGCKHKRLDEAEGAGEVVRYNDTEERILDQQEENERKIDSHRMKDNYRY